MSGNVKQFIDFTGNTNNDSGGNNATSIQPITDGEGVTGAVLARPSESLRQRTEAIRDVMADTLYLRDADRGWVITGPRPTVTWPGSTTAAASGIPVLGNALWILPLLTPGVAGNSPPVGSTFGVLHLKRSSDSANSVSVTSRRRSYAAGDQINVTVASGASFSCVLDVETSLRRTIKIVATVTTTLGTVISALNALTPPAPDNTQLVTAALEGGALSGDFLLAPQVRQYVSGNYDGEAHQIGVSTLSGFFASNPTQALAEGDTLCVRYDSVSDPASTGGRRQSLVENSNTNLSAGSLFNSRVHPEFLLNAIPVCKVINNDLVFAGGRTIRAGSTSVALDGNDAAGVAYAGGGAWADGVTNPATSVEQQLDKIVNDLSAVTGSAKIGGSATGSDLAADTVANQLSNLAQNWLKTSRPNTISGTQTFTNNVSFQGGTLSVREDLIMSNVNAHQPSFIIGPTFKIFDALQIETFGGGAALGGGAFLSGLINLRAWTFVPSNGNNNDIDPGSGVSSSFNDTGTPEKSSLVVYLNAVSGSPIVTGLAGGVFSRLAIFVNMGTVAVQFNHDDSNSLAANRFRFVSGANVTVPVDGAIALLYQGGGSPNRWRLLFKSF